MHGWNCANARATLIKASVVAFAFFLPALTLSLRASCRAETAPGTLISNTAALSFSAGQNSYLVVSNTVEATVMAVGTLLVTPKESSATSSEVLASGQTIARTFQITNTGNLSNAYIIQSVSSSAGSLASVSYVGAGGTLIPVTPGQTISPSVPAGQSLGVQVSISTQGVASGTTLKLSLSAQETVAGADGSLQSDHGQVLALVASGVSFVAPQSGNGSQSDPPLALVNGSSSMQALPGGGFTYTLQFENVGGFSALNVALLCSLPTGIHPDTGSVKLNGTPLRNAAMSGVSPPQNDARNASDRTRQSDTPQTLVIPLGNIAPMVQQTLQFSAILDPNDQLGSTYVMSAILHSDNAPDASTSAVAVFAGTANVVYDGVSGKPITGASISLVDPSAGAMPVTPAGTPVTPNQQNGNPFTIGSDGTYGFGLSPKQYGRDGASSASKTYYLLISASGYLNRKLQAVLTPDPSGGDFYSVTLTALDGQPLASAGGYGLSKASSVAVNDVNGVFGTIPLFTPNLINLSVTPDRSIASGGDRVVYTVQVANSGATALGAATVTSILPAGMVYAPGTGRIDGQADEPVAHGRMLTWSLPALEAAHTILYAAVTLPQVPAGLSLTNVVSAEAELPASPGSSASAQAYCAVQTVAGVFSDRIIITGRVFIDAAGTGRFTRGDTGVRGARIYLEDGESVVTDALGRFTFPAARPGMHVMRLDTTTLPANVSAYDDRSYDSRRSVRRLIHGVFDSGLMQDMSFALKGTPS